MTKTERISLVVLVGFLAAYVSHYLAITIFQLPYYPYGTFLFRPDQVGQDLLGLITSNSVNDPFHTPFRGIYPDYPPFAYLLIYPITIFGWPWAAPLYAIFFLGALLWWIRSEWKFEVATLVLIFLSYPILFNFDRLNLEILIFLGLALSVAAYKRGRDIQSAIWMSLAGAAKIYPLGALVLFWADKKYKLVFQTLALAVVWNVLALVAFQTSPSEVLVSYAKSKETVSAFVFAPDNFQHASSFFQFLQAIRILSLGPEAAFDVVTLKSTLTLHLFVAGIWSVAAMSMAAFSKHLFRSERLTLAMIVMIVLVQKSFDYKLVHLLIPLSLFLKDPETQYTKKETTFLCLLWGFILIPKGLPVLFRDISIGTLLNPLALLTLGSWILWKAYSRRLAPSPIQN
jgi:hypothetical protein